MSEAAPAPDRLEYGGVVIDQGRHRAYVGGRELTLTPAQFRLLVCLVQNAGRPVTRERLAGVASDRPSKSPRSVDRHVAGLRRRLGGSGGIETVWAVGYRLLGETPAGSRG